MMITLPDKSGAASSYMNIESIFIAEAIIQKQKINERHFL